MSFTSASVRRSTMGQLASRFKHHEDSSSNASQPDQPDPLLPAVTMPPSRSDPPNQTSATSGLPAGVKGGGTTSQRQVSSLVKTATAVARAIDERNVKKLKRALSRRGYRGWPQLTVLGGQLSSSSTSSRANQPQQASTSSPHSGSSLSLLEYAVEKNFIDGVDVLIKSISKLRIDHRSDTFIRETATAAFLRSCDSGCLRLKIFNMFIESALNGCLQIDLHAAYLQLVDHYMYRKPFDLACKPYFELVTLPDNLCRITPLGLAVMHDDPAAIEQFLQRGADIDAYDREGNTALLRAGYSLKRACFIKLLSLGADPNRRSDHASTRFHSTSSPPSAALPSAMTTSPLIAVCTAFGQCHQTRAILITTLISCGLNASPDRDWFASAFGIHEATSGGVHQHHMGLYNGLVRRIDEDTRRTVFELCTRPPTLEIQCYRTIRTRLARRIDMGEMERKVDLLPLPTAIKARLRLETINRLGKVTV